MHPRERARRFTAPLGVTPIECRVLASEAACWICAPTAFYEFFVRSLGTIRTRLDEDGAKWRSPRVPVRKSAIDIVRDTVAHHYVAGNIGKGT
jgi:hypothetical protein